MSISLFDLFSIGLGPSSSHTVGPIRAARRYLQYLETLSLFETTSKIVVKLYGSLALTGKGHATDIAIMLGLEGELPEKIDPETVQDRIERIRIGMKINLLGRRVINFVECDDLLFLKTEFLPYHPNGIEFFAYDGKGVLLNSRAFYSVGGGFVIDEDEAKMGSRPILDSNKPSFPYPFNTADELLAIGKRTGLSIRDIMLENEKSIRSSEEIKYGILHLWSVMLSSVERGQKIDGILPGGLFVQRRAKAMHQNLTRPGRQEKSTDFIEWVSLWSLAVNEENAAGSRVVTAPTNGSAGVIPAVLCYYLKFVENATEDGIITFFLVAAAIGILYKKGASISAAEMGCMGEIGVACSMAAAGLTAVKGGTNAQIENAAEISMEHHLGLTCDPIKGLVQIPCIERNTMGSIKAITSSLLAMQGDGTHRVSLDQVIATMKETGNDMSMKYKETSLGGLALNVPVC